MRIFCFDVCMYWYLKWIDDETPKLKKTSVSQSDTEMWMCDLFANGVVHS